MKTILLLGTVLFIGCSGAIENPDGDEDSLPLKKAKGAVLRSQPYCQVVNLNGRLILRHIVSDRIDYEAVVGAGGSIDSLNLPTADFLAGPARHEITDRVIQTVLWRPGISMPISI